MKVSEISCFIVAHLWRSYISDCFGKMSGVEEVLKDPPDKTEDEVETVNESKVEEIGSGECDTKPTTDAEASSLTGSWTLLEKEEEVVANVSTIWMSDSIWYLSYILSYLLCIYRNLNQNPAQMVAAPLRF